MASEARWGLKLEAMWKRHILTNVVGMASEARWGLKLLEMGITRSIGYVGMASEARWGLKLMNWL